MSTISVVPGKNLESLEQARIKKSRNFNIGTRKSKLALVQTDLVIDALATAWPDHTYTVKARDTAAGDIDKVTPFKDMAVKNIWTHELEVLMMEKNLDILVHALKDVPTQLPTGCEIGGVLKREDPRDALIIKAGRDHCRIENLPPGSVIGTSSIRRTAQLAFKHPHLKVQDIRGNLPTRLAKLDAEDGPFDALILGAAGLLRLGLTDRISQLLDSRNGEMLYAVGQGAIGIENRTDDEDVKKMVGSIDHRETHLAVAAERSLLRTLEGGCSAPLGVETYFIYGGENAELTALELRALIVSTDGKESAEISMTEDIQNLNDAECLGVKVAEELLKKGADKILAKIHAKRPTTSADLVEN